MLRLREEGPDPVVDHPPADRQVGGKEKVDMDRGAMAIHGGALKMTLFVLMELTQLNAGIRIMEMEGLFLG